MNHTPLFPPLSQAAKDFLRDLDTTILAIRPLSYAHRQSLARDIADLSGALEIAKHCDRARDLVRLCERAHCLSLTEDPRFAPLSERATSLRSST